MSFRPWISDLTTRRADAHVTLGERAYRRQARERRGGVGCAKCRAETVLVREFTSIFISTRRQLFIVAALAHGVANHSVSFADETRRERREEREHLNETVSCLGGEGQQHREKGLTHVWEKTRWFRDRSEATSDNYLPRRHSVLINNGA